MEPLTRIGHSRQSCDGFLSGPLLPASKRRSQEFGPPLEVPIKATLSDAQPRGKRFHRERPETGLRDEVEVPLRPSRPRLA